MRNTNPESILLYKELLTHIQKVCHEMRQDQRLTLAIFFYIDEEEKQDYLFERNRLPYWQAIGIRSHALRKIREHLADVGIIERKKGLNRKKPIRMKYNMNLSEFCEPRETI